MIRMLTILALMVVATFVSAQTKVTSKALGDQIWLPTGSYEVTPFTVNVKGDSVRSVSYSTTFQRDTTSLVNILITGYNKNGAPIISTVIGFQANSYRKWSTLITPIDLFISSTFSKIIKQ